jgi:ankyrin repeat protein
LSQREFVLRVERCCPQANSRKGWTALHWAAAEGHKDVARLLVERKASTTVVDKDGRTPVQLATENLHSGVVSILSKFSRAVPATATETKQGQNDQLGLSYRS